MYQFIFCIVYLVVVVVCSNWWSFTQISNILQQSAGVAVPKCKAGCFKPWWTDTLSDLKSASIEAHNIWKEAGRPSQGDIHRLMRQAKLAYKNAIRAAKTDADFAIA